MLTPWGFPPSIAAPVPAAGQGFGHTLWGDLGTKGFTGIGGDLHVKDTWTYLDNFGHAHMHTYIKSAHDMIYYSTSNDNQRRSLK